MVLRVDHQSGLANLVHDFSPDDFKNNVLALADCAKYFRLPTILTTSFDEVFVVTDASGTFNKTIRDAAWARIQAAGAQLMTWFGVACELHRDWRDDVDGVAALFSNHLPSYRCLITSYAAGAAASKR